MIPLVFGILMFVLPIVVLVMMFVKDSDWHWLVLAVIVSVLASVWAAVAADLIRCGMHEIWMRGQ